MRRERKRESKREEEKYGWKIKKRRSFQQMKPCFSSTAVRTDLSICDCCAMNSQE
jgi:hypothetical protein